MITMNQLSNLSYTNKDFNSIYAELLQYAKDVSYRWDPTVSNESDPGVVLLKLAAIIGDKDNYNIDQNILELFPASVSQPAAARQLFEQCGYSMRHYQAAEGVVNVLFNSYKGSEKKDIDSNGVSYTANRDNISIERFTMLTDANNKVVYTTTRKVNGLALKAYESVPVIEGTVETYTINNEEVITSQHVDSARRLYFTEFNVAENGIFIRNIDNNDDYLSDWDKVDNLSIQPLHKACYKFGVTLDGSTCFVEFPEDYVELFGNGIKITYVRTTGTRGNIAAKVLKNFFAKPDESLDIVVSNPLPILNGDDPETIDHAYKSYQRVKDTFETLVSLKDYKDYMVTTGRASNGYVCDRTNDIQHVSSVLETLGATNFINSYVDLQGTTPKLNAFDLCVYALEYVSSCTASSISEAESYYRKSFKLIDPASTTGRGIFTSEDDEQEVKSLQHDFKEFERDKILMIKNKYPLKATIIPRYKLNVAEQMQVGDNIRFALYEALKSKELTFGSAPEYDYIYDVIVTADERIKAIALEYPTYETYAVYWPAEAGNFTLSEVRVDSGFVPFEDDTQVSIRAKFREEILTKNILLGVTPVQQKADSFTYGVGQSSIEKENNIVSVTTSTSMSLPANATVTVRDNEAVVFSCPSLIEENKFSNYVKVLYNLDSSVQRSTYYTLKSGSEYIMFFWKASPGDSEYTCIKYDGTSESRANTFFTNVELQQTNITDATLSFANVGCSVSKLPADSDLNAELHKMSNEVTSTQQDFPCVLTGLHCITTYTTNRVHVNSKDKGSPYVYWIRNTTKQDTDGSRYYALFEDDQTSYTLSSDEYFLYTNPEKSVLHIVGEGTVIRRDADTKPTNNEWRCNPISFSDITDIDVLRDYWQSIPLVDSDATQGGVYVIEQELRVLGSGCQITSSESMSLSSTATLLSTSASVAYQETKDSSPIVLPKYGSDELQWSAYVRLDLNCGPEKPQMLTSNQSIEAVKTDGSVATITGVKYIQTDRAIQRSGGRNVDLTQIAGVKLLTPVTFMHYNMEASTESVAHNPLTLTTTINADNATIGIPQGNYLVSFRKSVATTTPNYPIPSSATVNPNTEPEYVNSTNTNFVYNIRNTKTNSVNLTIKGGSLEDPWIVEPLLKISGEALSATIWENIQERGGSLNFDPIACINNSTISDPLDANSFLKSSHAYNKFTICEWQETDPTNGTDIHVVTTIK